MNMMVHDKVTMPLLVFSVIVISACGIVYELMMGAASAYLMGNSIFYFSVIIGIFMCGFGVGSFLSTKIKSHLIDFFILIEIAIAFVGGFSVAGLFYTYAFSELPHLFLYSVILFIGTMIGLEIPILIRIVNTYNVNLRMTLGRMLGFDYVGSLIGALLFPLFLLPDMGLIKTSLLLGLSNIFVAMLCLFHYREKLRRPGIILFTTIFAGGFLTVGFIQSMPMEQYIEQRFYSDPVNYIEQTPYQRIVLTESGDDIRLFLDGNLQFSSADEYRYHEALVHPGMSLLQDKRHILVLGGGDGLVLRELWKYGSDIESVTLVDIDKNVINLCKTHPKIVILNDSSFFDSRLTVIAEDAYQFLEDTDKRYDFIIVDLPDPNDVSLNKLYTRRFYTLIRQCLEPEGIAAIQSTSPFYARKAFWCISETLKATDLITVPYHLYVPSFGDWGFNLVSLLPVKTNDIQIEVPTVYLTESVIPAMFVFGKDISPLPVEINTLIRPMLLSYYEEGWKTW